MEERYIEGGDNDGEVAGGGEGMKWESKEATFHYLFG